jgi:CMP-N-acetylneuraminic acid synthetase
MEFHDTEPGKDILIFIPARSGSKGVPDKNIRLLHGKPLMAYTIEAALQSKVPSRVIVSTDSDAYAEIARHHGAEVPVLRPKELAGDHSPLLWTLYHMLHFLYRSEGFESRVLCMMFPTYPFRTRFDLDSILESVLSGMISSYMVSPSRTAPEHLFALAGGRILPLSLGDDPSPQRETYFCGNNSIDARRIVPWRFVADEYELSERFHTHFNRVQNRYLETLIAGGAINRFYKAFAADEIRAIDINEEEDLALAEAVLQHGLFDFQGVIHE